MQFLISSDKVLIARLKAVLDPYLPVLTYALEPSIAHECRRAYLRSLATLYYCTSSEEDLHKELKRRVDAAVELGAESSLQAIRDYRNTKKLASLNWFIYQTARNVLIGNECLSTEKRNEVTQACQGIQDLAKVFKQEPDSIFPVRSRDAKQRWISESSVECSFLLGKCRLLSLRLGHERKRMSQKPR